MDGGATMTHLPSWAVPGRKVVCVDASEHYAGNPEFRDGLDGLTKGQIYTIRGVYFRETTGRYCIRVSEIFGRYDARGEDVGFAIVRFRPVITLEDDMLTFRSLLNTVPTTLTLETTE